MQNRRAKRKGSLFLLANIPKEALSTYFIQQLLQFTFNIFNQIQHQVTQTKIVNMNMNLSLLVCLGWYYCCCSAKMVLDFILKPVTSLNNTNVRSLQQEHFLAMESDQGHTPAQAGLVSDPYTTRTWLCIIVVVAIPKTSTGTIICTTTIHDTGR